MKIPEDIAGEVLDVAPRAREMAGFKNPFISLEGLEALCEGNETLSGCLKDVAICSLRYAETVCRFEQIVAAGQQSNENGDREDIERIRSTIHDTTIMSINILSRALKRAGKDNQWVSKMSAGGRAGYGKFALLIAFEIALQPQEGGN